MPTLRKLSISLTWDKNDPESMERYIETLEADYVSLEFRSKLLMRAQDKGLDDLLEKWHKVPGIFKFWI